MEKIIKSKSSNKIEIKNNNNIFFTINNIIHSENMFCNINFINKKKVRFSPFIRTFPNPTIIEKERYQFLWWTELDKSDAYFTMSSEIQNLQKRHPTMTVKQAMKLLYQPDNLTRYDPTNFTSLKNPRK